LGVRRPVPSNVEEFVADWDDFVVSCIVRKSPPNTSPEVITDLRSEVILRVIERDVITRYDGRKGASFGTYLWAVVENMLRDYWAKEHRVQARRVELSDEVIMEHISVSDSVRDDQVRAAEARILRDKVRRKLEGRPRLMRTFDMMLAGYGQREIASLTGWPETAVYSYVRRLRSAGRSVLQEGACTSCG
jgi:RNA polymerase sigma factor (sigma-70 family)